MEKLALRCKTKPSMPFHPWVHDISKVEQRRIWRTPTETSCPINITRSWTANILIKQKTKMLLDMSFVKIISQAAWSCNRNRLMTYIHTNSKAVWIIIKDLRKQQKELGKAIWLRSIFKKEFKVNILLKEKIIQRCHKHWIDFQKLYLMQREANRICFKALKMLRKRWSLLTQIDFWHMKMKNYEI